MRRVSTRARLSILHRSLQMKNLLKVSLSGQVKRLQNLPTEKQLQYAFRRTGAACELVLSQFLDHGAHLYFRFLRPERVTYVRFNWDRLQTMNPLNKSDYCSTEALM